MHSSCELIIPTVILDCRLFKVTSKVAVSKRIFYGVLSVDKHLTVSCKFCLISFSVDLVVIYLVYAYFVQTTVSLRAAQ